MGNGIDAFNIMFIVIGVFIALVFIFTILMIFSPKIRSKMMSKQIKATKYMLEDNKDNLTEMSSMSGDIAVSSASKIISDNEEILTNMSTKGAKINKEGVRITVKAIKDGIKDSIYCKYCGKSIETDSMFCKHCGKKQ